MNVFVLNTGRCGSTTFFKACRHMTNFTTGHESRSRFIGEERFRYPPNHIEADNRLSWVLGRLHRTYGDDAFYVHLRRDDAKTAKSFVNLYHGGIIRAYREGVLKGSSESSHPLDVSLDYCDTVNSNIELFLQDKSAKMTFTLENAKVDFRRFWNLIGAEGDLDAALAEWEVAHNSTLELRTKTGAKKSMLKRAGKRAERAIKASPVIAVPRRWLKKASTGERRSPWLIVGWALILAGLVADLATSNYNLAILYPALAMLLALAGYRRSWPIAGLLVVFTFAGYLNGPWPESAGDQWSQMLLSHRMLNRSLAALSVLAVTPMLSALIARQAVLNVSNRAIAMAACPCLILAVAGIDMLAPQRVNTSALFAVPLLLCAWTSSRRYLWVMTTLAVVAATGAFWWDADPRGASLLPLTPNRAIAIGMITAMAALMHWWMGERTMPAPRVEAA